MSEASERNEEIERLVVEEGLTYREAGERFGVSLQRIGQILKQRGSAVGYRGMHGRDHPNWKGGRVNRDGYVYVHRPGHPNANAERRVAEHRLVMEKKIGRYLRSDEHVHHINGKRDDNRPENLEIVSPKTHPRKHRTWSDSDLFEHLKRLALALGYTPSCNEVNDAAPPTHAAYVHRFGSYRRACRLAGLIPNEVGNPGHEKSPVPDRLTEQHDAT